MENKIEQLEEKKSKLKALGDLIKNNKIAVSSITLIIAAIGTSIILPVLQMKYNKDIEIEKLKMQYGQEKMMNPLEIGEDEDSRSGDGKNAIRRNVSTKKTIAAGAKLRVKE